MTKIPTVVTLVAYAFYQQQPVPITTPTSLELFTGAACCTLLKAPLPNTPLLVFLNGVLQKQGTSYSVVNNQIQFLNPALEPSDEIQILYYWKVDL